MAIATGLSPQQISFYEAFGFLKLPGLFRDDIERITDAFEAVFADETNPRFEYYAELHAERRRILIPQFIDKAPVLEALRHDPRMVAAGDFATRTELMNMRRATGTCSIATRRGIATCMGHPSSAGTSSWRSISTRSAPTLGHCV